MNVASPASEDRGLCADVADLRVCWPGDGAEAVVRQRSVPDGPRPRAGWRCTGDGADRRCSDRRLGGGPFSCDAQECVQRYPRMPDDGEWECVDLDGVVVCRRGVPAAGVVAGPTDAGWLCGARVDASPPERVCTDLSPDLPHGDTRGWRCRYDHERRERRICKQTRSPTRLGSPCDLRRPCPKFLSCTAGTCLPHPPAPTCWLDDDCDNERVCLLGTCVARLARGTL